MSDLAARMNRSDVERAAEILRRAQGGHHACEPVRHILDDADLATAYAVQAKVLESWSLEGREVSGHKIGLTNPEVQAQLGVDEPDMGVLYADMLVEDGGLISRSRVIQPRIEAEIAFILDRDIEPGEELDWGSMRSAIACAAPALEIVDSRIEGWDISIVDTVADNASCGLYVLGKERLVLKELERVGISMILEGSGGEISSGGGEGALADALVAAIWLARAAGQLGRQLRAGDVILSGSLGPMISVKGGETFNSTVGILNGVSVSFEPF